MSFDDVPVEAASEPTYKKYFLACKTKFFRKDVSENIGKGIISRYSRNLVLLVPQESDQRTRFLSAWMPETIKEYHELAAELGAPVHAPGRLSVHMGHDEKNDRPYLFCMSKGIEDILLRFPEGTLIQVTTLPANAESEADLGPDAQEGNFDVVGQ